MLLKINNVDKGADRPNVVFHDNTSLLSALPLPQN